jgi:hypothetical protein
MKHLAIIAACSLALGAAQAQALTVVYNVTLSGTESVPANGSTAFGSATVTVDDVADTVGVVMSFTGLTGGPASAAHIHCCVATSANGPVVIPFTGFPTAASGTYSNLFTNISPANIAGIESGLAYINIHNTVFPGGEIRGDILAAPVPEPSSAMLSILGLAALGLLRARRVRAGQARKQNRVDG